MPPSTEPTPDLSQSGLIEIALVISEQPWNQLGFASDDEHPATIPTGSLDELSQRVTALLLVRCIAIVAEPGTFKNLATSTICKSKNVEFPSMISDTVVQQLYEFVHRILAGYREVPYHNREHAYHVVQSMNKLIDMMVLSGGKTHGLKFDALALFAMVFSSLLHDVEHQGIPNRQLAIEDDRLAVLYNDQSMAENWSLYVGFSEFLQDEFQEFRKAIMDSEDTYRRFRRIVISMVLATDIASPERTQVGKSKWKEAFGDPFETIERKLRENRRLSIVANRRGSAVSAISGIGGKFFDDSHLMISEHEDDESEGDASYSITPENSDHDQAPEDAPQLVASKLYREFDATQRARFDRRMSATSMQSGASKFRQRLGILRTVDISGETIETYQRRGSMASSTVGSLAVSKSGHNSCMFPELADEPDELKASVVMETLLTAADVAHNLQGWDQMVCVLNVVAVKNTTHDLVSQVKWSGRLFLELRRAFVAGRGANDPKERWFENQIGFLESYLLPLARRLEDTGVFGEEDGEQFPVIVEQNRDKWLILGIGESGKIVAEGESQYPQSS